MTTESLIAEIKRHEAFRSHPYRDSEDILTIGYGLNLDDGISEQLATKIVEWTIEERRAALARVLPFWPDLCPARQEVFLNMSFNLGVVRFMGFRKMLAAAANNDIIGVCMEMKDSKWYRQVGRRAAELIEKYRNG